MNGNTRQMKKENVVIIGMMNSSSKETINVKYASMLGVRDVSIPKDAIIRLERISNGNRFALLIKNTLDFNAQKTFVGSAAPNLCTQEHIEIKCAYENYELINDIYINDDVPTWYLLEPQGYLE